MPRPQGRFELDLPLAGRPLEALKYAALAMTAKGPVQLSTVDGGFVRVVLMGGAAGPGAKEEFLRLVELEAVRCRLEELNRGLRDRIVRSALSGEDPDAASADEFALTEEQRKELDRIIAEVNAELKKESSAATDDPLGITKTWEEKHGRDRA